MSAGPFRRVLVGWDASPDAAEAMTAAAAIADGGHVVVLAVVPEAPDTEAAEDHESERPAIRRQAEQDFERARQAAASHGVRMSLQIVEDRQVSRAVCGYAVEHGFDLLVLGRHGDGGTLHPRLGSVAAAAARGSSIPVLLVSAG